MYLTTKIHQTEKHHEVDLNILRCLCYHAARLYNVGLYSVRQHFFNTQKYLSYNSNYKECCDNENYHIANIVGMSISDKDNNYFIEKDNVITILNKIKDKNIITYDAKKIICNTKVNINFVDDIV